MVKRDKYLICEFLKIRKYRITSLMIYRNITVYMNAGENNGFKTKIKCIKIGQIDFVKLTYLISDCS